MRHPARTIPFAELHAALEAHVAAKLVTRARLGPLALYHYSNRCVYDALWDDISLLARGLILDVERASVVATPFPKFFNFGERGLALPNEPFEAFEKLDGSLGIVFFHDDRWQVTTKGTFGADQASWAAVRLAQCNVRALELGTTYLFEIVYRKNRIVVNYDFEDLVLLGAYAADGTEVVGSQLREVAAQLGTRSARR